MSSRPDDRGLMGDDLYREIILDHYARPRHRGRLENPTHHEEGFNPTCGDEIELDLRIRNGVIEEVGIAGQGCSISQASASMLAQLLCGKSVDFAHRITQCFKERMLTRGDVPEPELDLGDLEALDGVRQYPVRIKCALLAWNTLLQALPAREETVPCPKTRE